MHILEIKLRPHFATGTLFTSLKRFFSLVSFTGSLFILQGSYFFYRVPISFTGSLFHIKGPHFFDRVPISLTGSLFSDFLVNSSKECQYSAHVTYRS